MMHMILIMSGHFQNNNVIPHQGRSFTDVIHVIRMRCFWCQYILSSHDETVSIPGVVSPSRNIYTVCSAKTAETPQLTIPLHNYPSTPSSHSKCLPSAMSSLVMLMVSHPLISHLGVSKLSGILLPMLSLGALRHLHQDNSQQPSGSRPRKDKSTDLIIQAAPKQPLEADLLGEGDDLGDQPQAKVCAFMAQYLICDITIFRHLWGDGSSFVTDIFTCYWRCKESPGMLSAPCAAIQWRSNAMTAMGPTTSADCAVLMHTSGPHIIGYSTGLATILSP